MPAVAGHRPARADGRLALELAAVVAAAVVAVATRVGVGAHAFLLSSKIIDERHYLLH